MLIKLKLGSFVLVATISYCMIGNVFVWMLIAYVFLCSRSSCVLVINVLLLFHDVISFIVAEKVQSAISTDQSRHLGIGWQ